MRKEWVPINNLPLELILDLSVVDIIILQHLVKISEPIVRIDLLEQINALLTSDAKVPASSFYRKLDKLEEKKMVAYVEDSEEGERKRNIAIRPTQNAEKALRTIIQISFFGAINYSALVKNLVNDFTEKSTIDRAENLLLINTEFMIDAEVLQTLGEFVAHTFLVADSEFITRYNTMNDASPVIQTNITEGTIREPDNFFDVVVIVGYEQNTAFQDTPVDSWLDEAIRVTKPGGILLLSTIAEIDETDHFLVKLLKDNAHESLFVHYSTEEKIINDLADKLENVKTQVTNGMLLGWGYKKRE